MRSTVFGAKLYLKKWGFEDVSLWADPEKGTLEYMGKKVFSVSIENGELKITYDPKWDQHFQHAEWTEIVNSIRTKLAHPGTKGDGKGKAAPV